jgi:hypothetical protein
MRLRKIFCCTFSAFLLPACVQPQPSESTDEALIKVQSTDVSNDQTAQNETPIAVNPLNASNMIVGANDWNYNDGCAVNATFDGGKTWTGTLPNGFIPGVTRYTNDPNVAGTGAYEAGGDPAIAFGPDGTAYFVCQAFNFTSPYQMALLVSRSTDGGKTWLDGKTQPLAQVTTWNGVGKSKGSSGQFADHESIRIDMSPTSPYYGSIYVSWAEFNGKGTNNTNGTHSPILVSASRDGGRTFSTPVGVTAGPIRSNQDARLVTAPDGTLYVTFDDGIQGGKGTAIYAALSHDGGATWSTPAQVGTFVNPVCTFPGSCFNLTGGAFRSGGSYPVPAYDVAGKRLIVGWPDIVNGVAQIYLTYAKPDLSSWTAPAVVAPNLAGDRFQLEMGVTASGRIDLSFYDRGYSANQLVDVTFASSSDGGATFSTKRVSSAGFDPSAWGVPDSSTPTGLRPFIGDYNGLVSSGSSAFLAWTGAGPTPGTPANSNLDIFFATVSP